MATNVQPTSPTLWAHTTNFWNNKDNGTVMKVIKFVGALFMYPFALLGDIAIRASQLVFGKKEESAPAPKPNWHQRVSNFVTNAGKSTWATMGTYRKTSIAAGILVATGTLYYTGFATSILGAYRNIAPTWLLGNAPVGPFKK